MGIIGNFDLLAFGLATAAIGLLGFSVYFNKKESVTNQAFLFFAAMTILYSLFNYMMYKFADTTIVLWIMRITLFSAVWHAFSFFLLFYVFPHSKLKLPKFLTLGILPITIGTSLLTLTAWVFKDIDTVVQVGQVANPVRGIAMPLFGMVSFGLVTFALVLLVRKTIRANNKNRLPYYFILFGSILSFSLILTFNLILPAVFDYVRFVPLAPVFFFPFILLTAYAIIRHGFFDMKIASTELLIFALSVAVLFDAISSTDLKSVIMKIGIFVLVLGVGTLLIKSVRKEIQQREEVAKLAKSLEKANLRLQDLDRQKTEFLSIASHQLRTPLTVINGYLELISDGAYGKVTKKLKNTLGDMETSNDRLLKLVEEFLDITRIEQGRTKFTYEKSDMNALITSVYNELVKKATDKGLKLVWKKNQRAKYIVMDAEKIRHVIFNFVDNAAKYSDKGSIKISVKQEKKGLTVRVIDQGFGFGKLDEANFFQKFYRGKNVEGTNVTGTGLGIYVCRQFVEKHGGNVWAHSDGLGKGSEFGFWIPNNAVTKKEKKKK